MLFGFIFLHKSTVPAEVPNWNTQNVSPLEIKSYVFSSYSSVILSQSGGVPPDWTISSSVFFIISSVDNPRISILTKPHSSASSFANSNEVVPSLSFLTGTRPTNGRLPITMPAACVAEALTNPSIPWCFVNSGYFFAYSANNGEFSIAEDIVLASFGITSAISLPSLTAASRDPPSSQLLATSLTKTFGVIVLKLEI